MGSAWRGYAASWWWRRRRAGLFAAYVWLRGFTPQILGTEKPMDVAFLASSMRAVAMPPPDPWFAGEPINYYYLGYLLHGVVGRLADVPPEIGFNLALATVFSTTVVATFGLAWNLLSTWAGRVLAVSGAAFAAFAVAMAGNLHAPLRLLQDAPATISAGWWAGDGIGWRSSRIVCDGPRVKNECPFPATETINEFPFFSFLLGDLHPHVMALPYSLVAIGLAWNLWRMGAKAESDWANARWVRIAIGGGDRRGALPAQCLGFSDLSAADGRWRVGRFRGNGAIRPETAGGACRFRGRGLASLPQHVRSAHGRRGGERHRRLAGCVDRAVGHRLAPRRADVAGGVSDHLRGSLPLRGRPRGGVLAKRGGTRSRDRTDDARRHWRGDHRAGGDRFGAGCSPCARCRWRWRWSA